MTDRNLVESFINSLSNYIMSLSSLDDKYLKTSSSYNGFEQLVTDVLKGKYGKFIIPDSIKINFKFKHHFPDINISVNNSLYGLELKSRSNGSWMTNGGSVFESITENYTDIYILFGSFNKKNNETKYKVRFDYYWNVTDSIKVTHSPRYHIAMDTNTHIFNSSIEYKELREASEENKYSYIREKLQEFATKNTWYLPEISDDSSDNSEVSVKPTLISDLPNKKDFEKKIKTEIFIIFPEDILGKSRADYSAATGYVLEKYFIYSPNFRDIFTAGGKVKYKGVELPKILSTLKALAPEIIYSLKYDNSLVEAARSKWNNLDISYTDDPVNDYKSILNKIALNNKTILKVLNEYHLINNKKIKLSNLIFDN